MSEKARVVKMTFTKEQILAMSADDLAKLLEEAGPGAKFRGTAVVRGPDGKPKYDDEAKKGQYAED